jgi:RNA polymerase sigma factor (sigma-70 family)
MSTLTAPGMPTRLEPARHHASRLATDADLADLVDAARAGDDAAWRCLVTRFERRLRDVVRSYRLSQADVDDVLQTTWLRLFTHLAQIREPAAVGGWLATTARRECLRILQSPLREQLTDDPELGGQREQDGPETELLASERHAVLNRALATLPERHRLLMTMLASDAAEDYQQISRTLAMPIGSIGPIRARSIARLLRHPELHGIRPGAG